MSLLPRDLGPDIPSSVASQALSRTFGIAWTTELLTVTFGPRTVVAEEFDGVSGVEQVFVYGSWARRHRGELGSEPGDVDVMVVGSPDRDEVYAAAKRAEQRLGMPVNPTVRSAKAWREARDALVRTAKPDAVVLVDHTRTDERAEGDDR